MNRYEVVANLSAEVRRYQEEYPTIRIECDQPAVHPRPWHVATLWRNGDDGRWYEEAQVSAASRRAAEVRCATGVTDGTNDSGEFDFDSWLSQMPVADRPGRGVRLQGGKPTGTEPSPKTPTLPGLAPEGLPEHLEAELAEWRASQRDVFEIRCPHRRCRDGASVRAERLDAVLDKLHAAGLARVTVRVVLSALDSTRRH